MGNYGLCLNINGASKQFTLENMNEVDAILFAEIAGFEWGVFENMWNETEEISFEQLFQVVKERTGMENLRLIDENLDANSDLKLIQMKKQKKEMVEALNRIGIYEIDKYNLLYTLAHSPRYKDLKVSDIYNKQKSGEEIIDGKTIAYQSELKAITITTEYTDENGEIKKAIIPVFAGTGGNLSSWIEDGRLKVTEQGIQAQKDAQDYVTERLEEYLDYDLGLCGYSKGGNIAAYVGVKMQLENLGRLKKVINMDGPGFDKSFLQENPIFEQTYKKLLQEEILQIYVPKDSFVGMMMFSEEYDSYVRYMDCETNFILDGHVYTTWNLDWSNRLTADWLPQFQTASDLSETAKILRKITQAVVDLPDDEFLSVLTLLENIVTDTSLKTLGDLSNKEKLQEVLQELSIYYNNASWIQKANLTKVIGTVLEPDMLSAFICSLSKEKWNINLDEIKPQIEELLDVVAQLKEEDAVIIMESLFQLFEGELINHINARDMSGVLSDITKWYTTLEREELESIRILKNGIKESIFGTKLEEMKQFVIEKVFQSKISWNGKLSFICFCLGVEAMIGLLNLENRFNENIQDCFQSIENQIRKSINKIMDSIKNINIDVSAKNEILQFLTVICAPGVTVQVLIGLFPLIKSFFSRQKMFIECNIVNMKECKDNLYLAYKRAMQLNERLNRFYIDLSMIQIEESDNDRERFSKKNRLMRSKVYLKDIERIKKSADRIEDFITRLQQWDLEMVNSLNSF